MKAAILAMLLPLLTNAILAEETNTPSPATVASNALPASVTIDGITYSNVTWRTVTPTTVTIFHRTGIASIPLEKLPPDLQTRFGYDPQRAAVHQQAQQEQAAHQQEQAAQVLERCKNAWKLEGIVVKRLRNGSLLISPVARGLPPREDALIVLEGISGSVGAEITGRFLWVRKDAFIEDVTLLRTGKDEYGDAKKIRIRARRASFCANWSPSEAILVNDAWRQGAAKLAVWDTE